MADLISLPTAAPAAPAVAGLATLLDGALAMPAVPVADPFAAFLASAQAVPDVAVPPIPLVGASKLQPTILVDGSAPATDLPTEPVEADSVETEATDRAQPTLIVNPELTPALAMLSALVPAQPATPRPLAPTAKPQATIVMKAVANAPIKTPAAPVVATPGIELAAPTGAPITAAQAAAAGAAPIALDLPANVTIAPISVDQLVAKPIAVSQDQAKPIIPALLATPVPVIPVTMVPTDGPTSEHAIVAAPSAPFAKSGKGVPTDATPATDAETAIIAETAVPADATAAPPVKTRTVEPRAPRPGTEDASVTPDRSERARQATPATAAPVRIARDSAPIDPVIAPPIALATGPVSATLTTQAPAADMLVQRQLVIADDGRWLDSLAQDITKSASGETIRFRLEPVNLGSLTVAIAQGRDGAAVRLTAETHRARDLLIDAQPALVAEARANGLRISETHVDLGGGNRDTNPGNNPAGGQSSFGNGAAGQQAMRQDGDARRQPDLPAPPAPSSNQTRSTAARTPARESGERFA